MQIRLCPKCGFSTSVIVPATARRGRSKRAPTRRRWKGSWRSELGVEACSRVAAETATPTRRGRGGRHRGRERGRKVSESRITALLLPGGFKWEPLTPLKLGSIRNRKRTYHLIVWAQAACWWAVTDVSTYSLRVDDIDCQQWQLSDRL